MLSALVGAFISASFAGGICGQQCKLQSTFQNLCAFSLCRTDLCAGSNLRPSIPGLSGSIPSRYRQRCLDARVRYSLRTSSREGFAGVKMKDGDTRKLIRVVGAVCMKDGLVFMAQRPIHKERGGLWEFPGGKVDLGETDQEALKREMQEELKVRCEVSDYIGVGTDERVELHCYRVEMFDTPELFEHDAVQWVPLDELRSIDVPPADGPIIEVSIVLLYTPPSFYLFAGHGAGAPRVAT